MIRQFVDNYLAEKHLLEEKYKTAHPEDYKEIVRNVVSIITSEEEYGEFNPDPERVHQIDDGNYQGTLVFVVASKGYQPDDYWYCRISYGSCSGCDTLERIRGYSGQPPEEQQVKDYMMLSLHVVEALKKMDGDTA